MNLEKYLIDYDKLKVGDKVWSIQLGDCEVLEKKPTNTSEWPIYCKNEHDNGKLYAEDGFYQKGDAGPSLFTSNPFADISQTIISNNPISVHFGKCGTDPEGGQETPSNPESILQEAERIVSGDRDKDYGSVKENFGKIAQMWSAITGASITERQVGWMMIALKAARDTHKEKRDNLVDAVGYVLCMEKMENGEGEIITAKNLQKAGFDAYGLKGMRDFVLDVRTGDQFDTVQIVVTEKDGKYDPVLQLPDDYIPLNLTTVTELITLAKLLK